jgi:D-glycero-alpha-D-manno-heptose 1-phosphate guanylyltransferase
MEAIVLAGGFGSRLGSAIEGKPKALAPVGGRPFLELLLRRLQQQDMRRVILSVGYLADTIREHFGDRFNGLELAYAVEDAPLGTGGATLQALTMTRCRSVFVLNGDTLVDLDYAAMLTRHIDAGVKASIAVVEVADCTRFGHILIEEDRAVGFAEKGQSGPGKISAGAYLIDRDLFKPYNMPTAFSMEKEFFEPYLKELRPVAFLTSGYFIDIGIPEDLARAQNELR